MNSYRSGTPWYCDQTCSTQRPPAVRYSSSWCHWLPVATDIQLLPFQSRSSANRSAFSSSNQPTSSLVSGSMTLTLAIGLTPPIYDVSPLEAAALHRGPGGQ